jgi:hypothetical protein
MVMLLSVLSGLAWTVVYVDCIRVGLRDRTYAMPVAALALNIAWESIHAGHGLVTGASVQTAINVVWALADAVIVATFVRFGRQEFPDVVTPVMFAVGTGGLFAIAFAVQGMFIAQFGWHDGAAYAAFLQNVLMSALFIAMFVARRGDRGQTLRIAIAKGVGTLAPTVAFGVIQPQRFILGLGLLCAVLDLAYVGLLQWARTRPQAFGSSPTPPGSMRAGSSS